MPQQGGAVAGGGGRGLPQAHCRRGRGGCPRLFDGGGVRGDAAAVAASTERLGAAGRRRRGGPPQSGGRAECVFSPRATIAPGRRSRDGRRVTHRGAKAAPALPTSGGEAAPTTTNRRHQTRRRATATAAASPRAPRRQCAWGSPRAPDGNVPGAAPCRRRQPARRPRSRRPSRTRCRPHQQPPPDASRLRARPAARRGHFASAPQPPQPTRAFCERTPAAPSVHGHFASPHRRPTAARHGHFTSPHRRPTAARRGHFASTPRPPPAAHRARRGSFASSARTVPGYSAPRARTLALRTS